MFRGESSLKVYFAKIYQNLWYSKVRRRIKGKEILTEIFKDGENVFSPAELFELKDNNHIIFQILERLGKKCKEVLKLWALGFTHQQIAENVGYDNANVSKKKKSLCLKKLKSLNLNEKDWL